MNKTAVGLPNTCAGCGILVTVEEMWYAGNDDLAISGIGFHSLQCATKHFSISGYKPPEPTVKETAEKPAPIKRKPRKRASSSTKNKHT